MAQKYKTTEQYIKALERLSSIESKKWPSWSRNLSSDFDRTRNSENIFGRTIEQERSSIEILKIKLRTTTIEERNAFVFKEVERFLAPRMRVARVGVRQAMAESNANRLEDYLDVMRKSGASEEEIARATELLNGLSETEKNKFFQSGYNQSPYYDKGSGTNAQRSRSYITDWKAESGVSLYVARLEDYIKDKINPDFDLSYYRSVRYNKNTEGKGYKPWKK